MDCKICKSNATEFYQNSFSFDRKKIEVNYFKCAKCGFLFSNYLDSFTNEELKMFYRYPNYLANDEWAKLEHTGKGEGRFPIILDSILYVEYLAKVKMNRILIIGNGLSKALTKLISSPYNYEVYAFDSFLNHPQEIKSEDQNLYYNSFDCIVSAEVYEHFLDPLNDFNNLKSFVRAGGWIVGTTGSVEQYSKLFPERPYYYITDNPKSGHSSFYSYKSITSIARQLNYIDYSRLASEEGHDSRKWRITFKTQ